jgi:hypothetical protein
MDYLINWLILLRSFLSAAIPLRSPRRLMASRTCASRMGGLLPSVDQFMSVTTEDAALDSFQNVI